MADGVTFVPFCGGSYPYADRNLSPQRSINFFPEEIEGADARNKLTLRPTEGERKLDVPYAFKGPCRGLWWSSTGPDANPCLFGVWGTEFVRIRKDALGELQASKIGNVGAGNDYCSICDNGFIVLVTDGDGMFGTNLMDDDANAAAHYRAIPMPELGGEICRATHIGYLNQRFVCNNANGAFPARGCFLFSWMGIDDVANMKWTWDSNVQTLPDDIADDSPQYYSAEQNADALTALAVCEGKIYLFGPRSFECWAPNSDANGYDPFSFIGGSQNQIGTQAPSSVAIIQRFVFWLGGSGGGRNMVWCVTGVENPTRVSTNAIEQIISEKRGRSSAYGFAYARDGHIFYCLSFPNDGTTLVYDMATKMWHERSTHNWMTGDEDPWRVRYATVAFDAEVVFGTDVDEDNSSYLCALDERKGTDMDGNPIVRKRVSPIIFDAEKNVVIRDFMIDAEVGTTHYLNDGPGSAPADVVSSSDANPTALLKVSRDGGFTWKDCPWLKLGRAGQYGRILRWKNLGMGRFITVELTISEKTPITVVACRIAGEACLL